MGYVGNKADSNYSSIDKQIITGNGGTSYTLSHAVANANEIEVFVNNVRQNPGVAYTVNNAALAMTGAVANTDSFYVVFIGKAVQTKVPPDGSVTMTKTNFYLSQATAPSSPVQGNLWFNTSASTVSGIAPKLIAVYNGNRWRQMSETVFTASGGNKTTSGLYTIHTFTSSGTFTPAINGTVDYLVVAGGGSGGQGGGGGAGAMRTGTGFSVSATGITVTVGAGGAAVSGSFINGNIGNDSVFSSITSTAGGYGARQDTSTAGGNGGSGGGGGYAGAGGAGTTGGNAGGGSTTSSNRGCGGGGGASAVGANGTTGGGGNGGNGIANSYSGSSVTYAGGGGGANFGSSGTNGSGGSGGGGAAGTAGGNGGTSGAANTGGGGGGASNLNGSAFPASGAGGSGIVIVRYLT